jgi:hypothetical protein
MDIFEIVFAGAADADNVTIVWGLGFLYRADFLVPEGLGRGFF